MADYLFSALVTLFVTIDPVALAPMFMVLTSGFGPVARREAALRASVTAGGVLIAFALVGEALIGVLGISISAFKIAGGLLLFSIAFEMVFERRTDRKVATTERATSADLSQLAIFPMAIPLTTGPGAISATILLASQATGWLATLGLIVVILILIVSCFAVFLLAPQIERTLGTTGRLVVSRLLGILLAALSVQFVADGVRALVMGT